MNNPFHLSVVVPDLSLTEDFYVNFLACKKGRDSGQWIDIIFFGHQLTIHQASKVMKAQAIDHFGVIMDKNEWTAILTKVRLANIPFEQPPSEKLHEDHSQSGKFVIKDPAGNLLEFKFYRAASRLQ